MNIKKWLTMMMLIAVMMIFSACYGGGGEEAGNDSEENSGNIENTDSSNAAEESSGGGTLYMATSGELPTVQTNGNLDGLSQTVMLNIYEGLFRLDENNELTEGMAEDYEMVENEDDSVTYTFNIREDALWSNGDPVTADDFVYAWKRAMNPETFSAHAYIMAPIVNANEIQNPDDEIYGQVDELGVEATDEKTLVVELNNNVPYFLELLSNPVMFPQNEEFIASQGDEYGLEPENVISNGPFFLETWNHDQGWVLSKNEEYWDSENVSLDAVNYKVAKDASTEVNLYETGDIDVANLTSEFVDMYAEDEAYTTNINTEVYFMRFNFQNEYLANENIRKALDMSYDKAEAAEGILKNGSIPAYFLVPEEFVTSEDGEDFRAKYGDLNMTNIEEAQNLWEQGLSELGTDSINLELLSYDDDQRKSMAEYMKNQWENNLPGLTVTINQQPNKQKLALEGDQDYDMSFSGWRNDISDPVEFLNVHLSDGPYNWQDFANEEYDSLVKNAQVDFSDLNQRFEDLQEAERILIEKETAISPIYQSATARLINPAVNNFVAHPDNTFSFQWVTMEE